MKNPWLHQTSVIYCNSSPEFSLELHKIMNSLQKQNLKPKKKHSPSLLIEGSLPYDSIIHAERKVGSPPMKNRVPNSAKVSPYQTPASRSISRSNSRVKQTPHKESSEKLGNASYSHASHIPKYRGSSNPRPPLNDSYYSTSRYHEQSYKKEDKSDYEKEALNSSKLNYSKHVWFSNDQSELNLSSFLNKKPPSSSSKREPNKVIKEKRTNSIHQINESSFHAKKADSHLKLKDANKYVDLKDLRISPSLTRDLQKLGLIIKPEALVSNKVYQDKTQEHPSSQFQSPVNANISGHYRERPKENFDEQRPIGTEEYYEEFFNTQKMTFDFEKARVSQRVNKKKDYYTPEPTPPNAKKASKNYFSNRDSPNVISYRPSETKIQYGD